MLVRAVSGLEAAIRHRAPDEPDPRRWWALTVTLAAGFIVLLGVTIVAVALPSLGSDDMARSSARWLGVVLVGATAAVMTTGLPATAKPLEKGTFTETFAFQEADFCGVEGLNVEGMGEISGRFLLNAKAGLPSGKQNTRLTRTVTNPATGLSATDTAVVLEKDLKVTDNGDGTVTILVLATGNATLVSDSSGKVIARNPGQIRYQIVIDLGGTPLDPSDDEFVEFLGFVKESTGRNDDFCAAAVAAIS